jgi:hypothetical protein
MGDWILELPRVSADVVFLPPASAEVIADAEGAVGQLPDDLKKVLARTNGLSARSFRLLSAFDPRQPKKTWESLQRANDPEKTEALGADRELLRRFLVFADIGNGVAVWDRTRGSIWFEEKGDDKLRETDLSVREFIETMVKNAE